MRPCLLVLLLVPAAALGKAHDIDVTWGKPAVTMDQYRTDQRECGLAAVNHDIANTDAARALVLASKQMDNLQTVNTENNLYDQDRIKRFANPELRWQQIYDLQTKLLARCLYDRGYRQFTLTTGQRKELGRHKFASPERRAYLHGLASDPAIIDAQRIVATVRR